MMVLLFLVAAIFFFGNFWMGRVESVMEYVFVCAEPIVDMCFSVWRLGVVLVVSCELACVVRLEQEEVGEDAVAARLNPEW